MTENRKKINVTDTKKEWIRSWMKGIFYPPRCPFCGQIPAGGWQKICEPCQKKIKIITEPRCKKCGRPVRVASQEFCYDCAKRETNYEEGMAVYLYEGEVSKAVQRMKFQNKRAYAQVFGKVMAQEIQKKMEKWKPDAIIPVPMYRKKQKKRGYNQAEWLAREIASAYEIPLLCDLVVRVRDTKPQKDLARKDRQKNLKKAFILTKNEVELKKILIVDDIYTTGSTVNAVAEALKRHGAEEVYFFSLCIGRGEER